MLVHQSVNFQFFWHGFPVSLLSFIQATGGSTATGGTGKVPAFDKASGTGKGAPLDKASGTGTGAPLDKASGTTAEALDKACEQTGHEPVRAKWWWWKPSHRCLSATKKWVAKGLILKNIRTFHNAWTGGLGQSVVHFDQVVDGF